MKLYAGIDLHSSNNYIGIIDEQDNKILGKRIDNHLPSVLEVIEPYRKDLKAVVVESTYNWYCWWMVFKNMVTRYVWRTHQQYNNITGLNIQMTNGTPSGWLI